MKTFCFVVVATLVVVVVSLGLIENGVEAHSWVACADYRITNERDSYYYNDAACFGYPRNFQQFDRGFGVDAGYNFQLPASGEVFQTCPPGAPRTNPINAAYTERYPMPNYTPGQEVCLAWPTKNHVAATCTDQFMPDGGVKIFMSPVNPTSDPPQSVFERNLLAEMPKHQDRTIDFKGYQNCSKFCENMDKSLCVGCFILPTTVAPGAYTLQWYWIFNPGEAYSTCIDVTIGNGGGLPPPPPPPPSSSSSSPSPSVSLSRDTFIVTKYPTTFSPASSFDVKMKFNANGDRMAIVDILSLPDYSWYGKGVVAIKGVGEVDITVTPQNDPPAYKNYVLKAWIVGKAEYDANPAEAFTFELNREELPTTVGSASVYSEDGVIVDGSDSGKKHSGWVLAVLFFSGMIASLLVAGVVFWFVTRKKTPRVEPAPTTTDYRLLHPNV